MKVIYSVATKFGGGGIGTTAYQAVRGILRAGFLDKVWASAKIQTEVPDNLVATTNTGWLEGVPRLPSAYRWFFKDLLHDSLVSLSLTPSDIFHVWNGHGLHSARLAKKMGAKVVIERASSHPLTYEGIMSEELRIRGLRYEGMIPWNRARLLKEIEEADFIAVPSDFAYRSMVENGMAAEKLVKIPFGVDLNLFRPVSLNVQRSTFNVLFVGQIGFRKGVLYLLEAWRQLKLKDAVLTIASQTDPEIKRFLEPFYVDSSIKFLGFSPTLPLYQSSDLFVLPSLEEGSALVNYEALACGLPVVTTFESGSVIEDGVEGYLVPAGDIGALAERISQLYENPSLRESMSRAARIKAEKYSWDKYGENLVSFYRKII